MTATTTALTAAPAYDGVPIRIFSWEARRAGASITITGRTASGMPIKIVGVNAIESSFPLPIATDKNGNLYELDGASW